jgi:hypothetical protein
MQAHALTGHAQVCEKVLGSSADDDDEAARALDSLRTSREHPARKHPAHGFRFRIVRYACC